MLSVFVCPDSPNDVAEAYCLGKLNPGQRESFEDHYLVCPRCAEAVESTHQFVVALRQALPLPRPGA